MEEAKERQSTHNREEAADRRAASDLDAQWAAANAAAKAARLTEVQTWIGGLGFVALLGTLIYQAKGTYAANRSIDILIRAEDCHISTSYVGVCEVDPKGGSHLFNLKVYNAGKTAAVVESYVLQVMPSTKYSDLDSKAVKNACVTSPPGEHSVVGTVPIRLVAGQHHYVGGHYTFRSNLTGDRCERSFCVQVSVVDTGKDFAIMCDAEEGEGWPGGEVTSATAFWDRIKRRRLTPPPLTS